LEYGIVWDGFPGAGKKRGLTEEGAAGGFHAHAAGLRCSEVESPLCLANFLLMSVWYSDDTQVILCDICGDTQVLFKIYLGDIVVKPM
jgi:hypothetical protein